MNPRAGGGQAPSQQHPAERRPDGARGPNSVPEPRRSTSA